jgi:hypothetical protein
LALAQAAQHTQTTASYKIVLEVGAVEKMLTPDQATKASEGEVMATMPGMAMSGMSMTDAGHPVNHHLEVHLYNRATGALITNQMPTIRIRNQGSGATRQLASVMAMYDVKQGMRDFHFGTNVYLPAGAYTITVAVGRETAVFNDVMVGGGESNMGGMAMPPTRMPAAGAASTGAVPTALLVLGLVLLGTGLRVRRSYKRA